MSYFKVLIILFLFYLNIQAEIRYVSKTGNPEPPYLTWETACDSIQKAIDICVEGDTIVIGTGIYSETIVMIQGLTVLGSGIDSSYINIKGNLEDQIAVKMNHLCEIKYLTIIADSSYAGSHDICVGTL